jgi:excisionase family DNA binding protein
MPPLPNDIWTATEVAAYFRVDVETVRRWHRHKELRAMEDLRVLRFHASEVERFMNARFGLSADVRRSPRREEHDARSSSRRPPRP